MNLAEARRAGLEERVAALLANAQMGTEFTLSACTQGGNNRIHRVETAKGIFAVKEYFRHPDDPRDRLASEAAFLEYANSVSPGATPRLLAVLPDAGLTLVEFIDGGRLGPGDVGPEHVDAAVEFFRQLNEPSARARARLPAASEASFSIDEQLSLIDRRVAALLGAQPSPITDTEAGQFFRQLHASWQRIAASIRARARTDCLDRLLPQSMRCISPSDFGFHNALVACDGRVRFIDFEYAGWDDPGKTAADFFAQPAVPVPIGYFERFTVNAFAVLPDPEAATRRALLLRPAYLVKWCCIALNIFVPVHLARRRFANPLLDETALRRSQLSVAVRLLHEADRTDEPIRS